MSASADETRIEKQRRRTRAFLAALREMPVGEPVTIQEFLSSAGDYIFKSKDEPVDNEKEPAAGFVTRRMLTYSLDEITNNNRLNPLEIELTKNTICVVNKKSAFEERNETAYTAKQNIGCYLWYYLFNRGWKRLSGNFPGPEGSKEALNKLDWKKRSLLKNSQCYILADAGSTVAAMIDALLLTPKLPLSIPSNTNKYIHTIHPVILTGSFPVVRSIQESVKHRDAISIDFIGGKVRGERMCTTGDLPRSDTREAGWITGSKVTSRVGLPQVDICLVSLTGIYLTSRNGICACCDDREEGIRKTLYLDSAGENGLRVLAFDLSKFTEPDMSNIFTAVNYNTIDLVVVSGGETSVESRSYNELVEELKLSGVAVLGVPE